MKKLTAWILFTTLLLTGCGCRPVSMTAENSRNVPAETASILSNPEAYLPALTVRQGENTCEANIGSYNWQVDNGDGTNTGICVDAVHPLDIADSLPLLEANSLEAQLDFPATPKSIMVWCWENNEEDVETIPVENGVFALKPGPHVYQVTACWPGSDDFTNIVHYSFRANTPEQ